LVQTGTAPSPSAAGKSAGCGGVDVVVEEVRHTALEHDDLDVGIGRELVDDLGETAECLADDEVHGRVREGDLRDLW
jgi:hypothetical protein